MTATQQTIDRYIAEISRYKVLTAADELVLARRYRDAGDLEAGRRLVVANLRFVVKIAHEYRGYGLRLLDIIQEGNIGLMKAVAKFDPDRGYRLISYAVWWIRAYIQNFIMRSWSLVKLGTTQAQRKLFFRLRSERDRADRDAIPGERATVADLAQRLAVTEMDIRDMEGRMSSHDFSLEADIQEGGRQTHKDLLPSQESSAEEALGAQELHRLLHRKVDDVLPTLNDKERYIVHHRLLTEDPETLQCIGDHFGISRERARQIEGNVLRKLRLAFRGTDLAAMAA